MHTKLNYMTKFEMKGFKGGVSLLVGKFKNLTAFYSLKISLISASNTDRYNGIAINYTPLHCAK